MVPGFAKAARCRCAGGRYPYSGRAASAASSLPATRIAQFARIRRSTSLAVCCAPIKMTPKDRPRSAKSSRICLIGLSPSRGGVLVELIKHDEHQRPARALTLLTGKLGTQRDANHEPLRPVPQAMKVNDRHLSPRRADRPLPPMRAPYPRPGLVRRTRTGPLPGGACRPPVAATAVSNSKLLWVQVFEFYV